METMVKSFKDFQRQIRLLRGMWGELDHVFFDIYENGGDLFFVATYQKDPDAPVEYTILYDAQRQKFDLSWDDKGLTLQEVKARSTYYYLSTLPLTVFN